MSKSVEKFFDTFWRFLTFFDVAPFRWPFLRSTDTEPRNPETLVHAWNEYHLSFWRFFPCFAVCFASKLALSPFKRSVLGAWKGHFRARKGQMVELGVQDPETTWNAYKIRENVTTPQLASLHWLASKWAKIAIKQGKNAKKDKWHLFRAPTCRIFGFKGKGSQMASEVYIGRGPPAEPRHEVFPWIFASFPAQSRENFGLKFVQKFFCFEWPSKILPETSSQTSPRTAPLQNANFAQSFALHKPFNTVRAEFQIITESILEREGPVIFMIFYWN